MSPEAEDPVALARRLIDANSYLTLGTADAGGRPWVSPVWYAAAGYTELLWVSSPDARHCRNLSVRPEVSIAIFDSRVPLGQAQAVYMSAVAQELSAAELERGIEIFSRGSQAAGARHGASRTSSRRHASGYIGQPRRRPSSSTASGTRVRGTSGFRSTCSRKREEPAARRGSSREWGTGPLSLSPWSPPGRPPAASGA
jgi:hypothetical protein